MLSPATNPPYTPLPGEQHLSTSPPRIAFSITTPAHFPGKQQQPFSLTHGSGTLYLTNRRLIYLPDKTSTKLQSFAAPITNLHDSHVTAPFFGPNVWTALLQPVPGGGIPVPGTGVVELKLTFKEGGAFDFHTQFERVKERLQHALEMERMRGDAGPAPDPNLNNVNLEDLPAYEEESSGPLMSPTAAAVAAVTPARVVPVVPQRDSGVAVEDERPLPKPTDSAFSPPDEAPPAYEDSQLREEADGARNVWRS